MVARDPAAPRRTPPTDAALLGFAVLLGFPFAWMLIASTEGAVALARAQRTMNALDIVEQQLLKLAARLGTA